MTGRYAIRSGNGVVPLGSGVYGLVQWEVTMAEMLSDAGYATGMFGKWHLGENYPMRAQDQGFHKVVVHGGGGIGQFVIIDGAGDQVFPPEGSTGTSGRDPEARADTHRGVTGAGIVAADACRSFTLFCDYKIRIGNCKKHSNHKKYIILFIYNLILSE